MYFDGGSQEGYIIGCFVLVDAHGKEVVRAGIGDQVRGFLSKY